MAPPSPQHTDVLIAGSGSAGLCASLWLARHGIPHITLERRPGPLRIGQADGVQCRTVEILESFGLADTVLREAYHVLEVAFWSSAPPGADESGGTDSGGGGGVSGSKGIRRTHFAADTAPGLSHLPHVILNQARINGLLIEEMERSAAERDGSAVIEYGCEVRSVVVDGDAADPQAYAVRVTAVKDGEEREYRAKYVLGCDGAHSAIRKSLGVAMVGDSSDAVWGVMDMYPRTNFPDIRKKVVISSEAGSLLIVPREGDSLVRFYIEQPVEAGAAAASLTLEALQARAREILSPYNLDVAGTAWWSAYAIGQRLAERFHASHRVFLTGDAAHTHSPKAGQGMNVSLQDGYNMGWKLAAVLSGKAHPHLLETYVSEREVAAADLIEFDAHFTRLFSSRYRRDHDISPAYFQQQFVRAGRYTAGQATCYGPSVIVRSADSAASTPKALTPGMRFPSAQVVRFSDAKAMPLLRALPSDCRWRVVVFAGDILEEKTALRLDKVATVLSSIVREFTPPGSDPDCAIEPVLVLKTKRTRVEQDLIPDFFWPVTGKWGIRNLHRVFVDDDSYNSGHGHAYQHFGIDPRAGILVVVRPDQYIGMLSSLENAANIRDFFGRFLIPLAAVDGTA